MPILNERTLDFVSSSVAQTERLGVRLGELLQPGDLICLSGDLGAGKTVVARGIGRGWGSAIRVTSPSYVLVNEYPRLRDGRILYHIDGYRLESEAAVLTVGLDDIFDQDAAWMVEWPDRIETALPPDRLWIELSHETTTRRKLRFEAFGERAMKRLTEFKRSAFGV